MLFDKDMRKKQCHIKAWLLLLLHRVRISLKTLLKLREKENPNSFSRLVLKWFFVQKIPVIRWFNSLVPNMWWNRVRIWQVSTIYKELTVITYFTFVSSSCHQKTVGYQIHKNIVYWLFLRFHTWFSFSRIIREFREYSA